MPKHFWFGLNLPEFTRTELFPVLILSCAAVIGYEVSVQSTPGRNGEPKAATEQTTVSAQPEAVFDSGYSALNAPFEVDRTSKAYIRGRVNGSEELRILLDTGVATMFVLDRRHAERLDLKLIEGYKAQGSGATRSSAALAKDVTVRLSGRS